MPSDSPDKTYYCTQCHIETTLGKVCPKCHRKTTLRPRNQTSDSTGGGGARRASSGPVAKQRGPARRVWLLGGALATVAVIGVVWWVLANRRSSRAPKKAGKSATSSSGPAAPGPSNRIFGAPRPGGRVAPQGPPRICGAAYRVSIHSRFAVAPGPAPKPGRGAAKPRPAPRPRPKGTEAWEHQHSFLIAKRRGRWAYVPLAVEIKLTINGRTVTGLKLDRTGGLVPDPRTRRRTRRLGYHDSLQPGLRISDLIGRVQADLAPDPRGGLKVTRQRLKNNLVSQWVQMGIDLTRFLRPHPPRKGARVFEDRRLPPKAIAAGLKSLVRRFRLQPAKKSSPAGSLVTYGVDAPALSMRRAKSTTPVRGQVSLAPGEPLPRRAELRLDKVPRKGGGTQAITIRLDHLGQRCNDKQ